MSGWTEKELVELQHELRQRYLDSCGKSADQLDDDKEDFDSLMKALKKCSTLESLCDELDVSPKIARDTVRRAREAGYSVCLEDGCIGKQPRAASDGEMVVKIPDPVAEWSSFAVASDLHIGSKHHLCANLEDFVERAYVSGVRTILVPGDWFDGVYKFSIWEQSHRGFAEQVQEGVATLPKRPGLSWVGILGNHDETFESGSGIDACESIMGSFRSRGRDDVQIVGSRGSYVRLVSDKIPRGVLVELWHPKGCPAYSISYKPQRHVEQYPVGQKPDVCLVGHFHQAGYFTFRGVHCLQAGTFQGGQSSFGKSIGGAPSIGGWICHYGMTEGGTIRSFSPEWIAYYEKEEPRSIGLG
jgi:hypothetical protein